MIQLNVTMTLSGVKTVMTFDFTVLICSCFSPQLHSIAVIRCNKPIIIIVECIVLLSPVAACKLDTEHFNDDASCVFIYLFSIVSSLLVYCFSDTFNTVNRLSISMSLSIILCRPTCIFNNL